MTFSQKKEPRMLMSTQSTFFRDLLFLKIVIELWLERFLPSQCCNREKSTLSFCGTAGDLALVVDRKKGQSERFEDHDRCSEADLFGLFRKIV